LIELIDFGPKGRSNQFKDREMAKIPVKMRAVVYGLSPFQQKIMPGLWKDLPGKIHHKITDNWISTILLLGPLVGTYSSVTSPVSLSFLNSILGLGFLFFFLLFGLRLGL